MNEHDDIDASEEHSSHQDIGIVGESSANPDAGAAEEAHHSVRFPFFDMNDGSSTSQNNSYYKISEGGLPIFSPSPATGSYTGITEVGLEDGLSPIAKNRESDSGGSTTLEISSEDPTASGTLGDGEEEGGKDAGLEFNQGAFSPFDPVKGDAVLQRVVKGTPLVSPQRGPDEFQFSSDLSSVKRHIGKSSHDFITRIQSAAHRRKMEMTRSRDSLMAKEMEQQRSIAESKAKAALGTASSVLQALGEKQTLHRPASQSATAQFKARPMPKKTGSLGAGGLEGVPKVAKRPTTTPFSPLLGKRRPEKPAIAALEKPKTLPLVEKKTAVSNEIQVGTPKFYSYPDAQYRGFKARPVPEAVGRIGHGGLSGVPKVPKRPATVPFSPQLGPRRRSNSTSKISELQKRTNPAQKSLRQSMSASSLSTVQSRSSVVSAASPLLGLDLLAPSPSHVPSTTTPTNDENLTPRNGQIKPFEPHSTVRAKKRADYDSRRRTMMQQQTMETERQRERAIRRMRRELEVLGRKLE